MHDNEREVKSKPDTSRNNQGAKAEKASLDFPNDRANNLADSRFEMIRPLRIGDRYRANRLGF